MKISLVTISFNQAEFLERTIRSVIDQAGVNLEYIVVDPGSTDGSREIISRYEQKIAHILLDPDRGPADGLNRGFSKASGDVFGYLNSDDTLEPNTLAKIAAYFRNNPDIDVVSGHGWLTDSMDRRLRRIWSDRFEAKAVAHGASVQVQPSTFFRREAFHRAGGFNIENRSNWDGELLVDLYLSNARFGYINDFLSTYRLHSVSITNSGALDDRIRLYNSMMFEKLMGRPRSRFDTLPRGFYKLRKHVLRPRSSWERLTRGKVYRRGV